MHDSIVNKLVKTPLLSDSTTIALKDEVANINQRIMLLYDEADALVARKQLIEKELKFRETYRSQNS